ncbi:diguanylate cyclase (GGDEF)-like protein [Rhizobium sp. PP-F2F-G38]|uniref:GGDEF domain-containing protein n=1 Tax=Rhizobium sp. PP-CC-3G-465 TaxID=2135648 RepID=UPI000D97EB61|nr:diguanylate cyclase (GGDEF)-like protein [Rhizobium sp. PP-WC-1G-195]PYE94438.1 diguanylate cyclase (GGDEF)-like protein [Rhizobium sp. PP-F2F-G38]TCP80399.1 diguanylate cyclase (GGDEF)-like protein [Rhizobium sp. PP-CC-2G-626]TCQ09023.1 diguanylate cyclase (GGDEF)-like protein [Rhizobium sp. PP-F2F-G36]TCQ23761.1 diguanylate cyclase (GGDEF)-like protein [Rhizobium sp. PP-CC-3G-465]
MIAWAKRTILVFCATDAFASRRDVFFVALRSALGVVFVGDILNVIGHLVLDAFGLLPYPLVPAATVGVLITTLLGTPLIFTILYIIGLAIHDLSISRARFEALSRTDQLSGLLNRRAFLAAYAEHKGEASLVVFDIDRFKALNDSFGHEAGDRAIVSVASVLNDNFQPPHVLARIGGEEFAVLIVGMEAAERMVLAGEAVVRISRNPINLGGVQTAVTVSAGVAEFAHYQGFAQLFAAADKALYIAKASGRNLILHADDIPEQLRNDGNHAHVLPPALQAGVGR